MYCDHVEHDGESLFRLVCDNDLEGIVAKRKFDPYIENQASWLKIRNPYYSQWEAREELFERERESDPDLSLWDDCARACAELARWLIAKTCQNPAASSGHALPLPGNLQTSHLVVE